MNVSNIIKEHVAERPDETAIIFGYRRISYLELDRLINRIAGGLLKMGLKQKDVLSIFLPSLPELIMGYLGAVRAGLTVNVVNAMLKEQEVVYILKDCATRAVLVDSKRLPIIEAVRPVIKSLGQVIVLGDPGRDDYTRFDSVLDRGDDQFEPVKTQADDLCHLMYTSGTTGFPKGVMATHLNVWHNATRFGAVHFAPTDTIMVATPIFHCWGLVNGTFGMLSKGGSIITVERFNAAETLDEIERFKPTIFQGVPPMYTRDVSSVVFCLSAATKMPENLIRQVADRLKWHYAEAWGLTEVSCVGTTAPYSETRIGSCGIGMDDAEIKVVDDDGSPLPPGEQGELCIRGTCVTNGYLNKPEATKEAFDTDGWFHSGDVAYMDEDGFAYIVDRKKDMINVGGEKVFPSEVEDMMLVHPKIKDLVVVGILADVKGEAPKAFIQLNEGETATEEEIREFCKKNMAPFKVPIAVEFVAEVPRSVSGKALRRTLRDKQKP
jgi:long-chain acyl-CoA synthetase